MIADSTVTVSGAAPPFLIPPPGARGLMMNPAAYLAAGAAPFLYGNNALRYKRDCGLRKSMYNYYQGVV